MGTTDDNKFLPSEKQKKNGYSDEFMEKQLNEVIPLLLAPMLWCILDQGIFNQCKVYKVFDAIELL